MEAVYRVEKVSPIADSHGGNSGDMGFFLRKKKAAGGSSFKPVLSEASGSVLNSASAQEVFEGILNL